MNTQLSNKIIQQIKKQEITPRAKIFFIFKNMFFWLFSIFSVLIGAISFATILYNLSGKDEIFTSFSYLPFFWIIILSLFLVLSIKNYQKTDNFYKYNTYFIFLIIIIFAFGFGAIMFSLGVGQKTETLSQKYLPFYNRYAKILTIKKEIFKNKLIKIGITPEILAQHPELKEKIDKKFRENVLGKTYLYSPSECLEKKYSCENKNIKFSDELGCGCRKLYLK